jgi:hypothetical protein
VEGFFNKMGKEKQRGMEEEEKQGGRRKRRWIRMKI